VLAQIGITFKSQGQIADPPLAGTLEIDESKLDEALLNQADAVRTLFAFGLSSSSAEVRLAGFDGNTRFDPAGYTLNVAWADGKVVSANIGGAADGSDDGTVEIAGNVLTVTAGNAKGLKLLFTGSGPISGVQLDVSVGIGAKLHSALGAMTSPSGGLIASEIGSLEQQQSLAQSRAERLEERLERERERLLERFVAMETAITAMNRLIDGLKQQLDSFFNSGKR
jgi:flagellar hook-associated protein 2